MDSLHVHVHVVVVLENCMYNTCTTCIMGVLIQYFFQSGFYFTCTCMQYVHVVCISPPNLLQCVYMYFSSIPLSVCLHTQPLQIKSVVAVEGLKGYIYVESYKQQHVKQVHVHVGVTHTLNDRGNR